jgi:hypothetical protein
LSRLAPLDEIARARVKLPPSNNGRVYDHLIYFVQIVGMPKILSAAVLFFRLSLRQELGVYPLDGRMSASSAALSVRLVARFAAGIEDNRAIWLIGEGAVIGLSRFKSMGLRPSSCRAVARKSENSGFRLPNLQAIAPLTLVAAEFFPGPAIV